ncbi:NAD(P)-dependent dehydrogenase (short-subunit alcohol dehydrogenase family) [Crossiella equi]|uniref:NAD(P)-dependent dehydrogenase (Short-subunit alcohol dehydrogenase family) n=1 Tax=Crossiella equi TaxID=130796 RepID=A0ABS5A514_9PSEU|nr:NAD(P)-binding domain-containing protein [Crossiella equi]MBP2471678.1 NAD(P)-dependent dehydrogenase (short-subunit alcohol dehydrogenase family) [Crossiella equi]
MTANRTPVSVLGLGRMGEAIARTLLRTGHPVTVWNRTPAKADALVAEGARPAATVAEAVTASPLVIAVVLDAPTVRTLLEPAAAELRGRTLLNLSTSGLDDLRELSAWVVGQGAEHLDGAVMAVPQGIGTPDAQILLAGSRTAHHAYGEELAALGTTRFVGEDPAVAELFSYGLLSAGYGLVFGFAHGAALLDTARVRPTEYLGLAVPWLNGMIALLTSIAAEFESRDYGAGESSVEVNAAALAQLAEVSRAAGVDGGVHEWATRSVQRLVDAGYGKDSVARLFDVLRPRA